MAPRRNLAEKQESSQQAQPQSGAGAMQPGQMNRGQIYQPRPRTAQPAPQPQTEPDSVQMSPQQMSPQQPSRPSMLTPAGRPMQPSRHGMPASTGRQPRFGQMPAGTNTDQRSMQPGQRPMQSMPYAGESQAAPVSEPSAGLAPGLEARQPGLTEEKEPVIISGQNDFVLGDPDELERLEQEERSGMEPRQLWDSFRKRYPKIHAFDCDGGCEILTIKPQDIGLLPRETWTYGNNSFLLHGYYNYRYLILAKVENANSGGTRYLLGVPGNYYSNEKYMASMFGFPHFVLAKKQPTPNGRFGYWYVDVKLDNLS